MMGSRITAIVLIVLVFFIGAWDVYAGMRWGSEATVSSVLNGWFVRRPIIALVIGILAGHILWPLK